jgi:GT2 family glycosyltransferase
MLSNWPFVSVIIINYNGQRYLDNCLTALQEQTYPSDRFEVVVVDNGSSDNSVEWVRQNYPWVKIIQSPGNLGFAGGNNLGVRQTQGDYVAFLNNDTCVDCGWLQALVTACEQDPTLGGACSKLLLFDNYLKLALQVSHSSANEPVWIYSIQMSDGQEVEYLPNFSEHRWDDGQAIIYRCFKDEGEFRLPVPVPDRPLDFTVEAAIAGLSSGDESQTTLEVYLDDEIIACQTLSSHRQKIEVTLSTSALAKAVPLIQNAGVIVFANGMGKDRGTYSYHGHHYEEERGQYDQQEEVFAGCGASFLCRRAMLEDVGLFDEDFFMYYEDVDLSWRARLRGWKILYVPSSVVRHVHRGSSINWDNHQFNYQVERNRLALLFKNASFRRCSKEWSLYFWRTLWMGIWLSKDTFLRRCRGLEAYWTELQLRIQVVFSLLRWLPRLIGWRWRIWRGRRVSPDIVESWLVEGMA